MFKLVEIKGTVKKISPKAFKICPKDTSSFGIWDLEFPGQARSFLVPACPGCGHAGFFCRSVNDLVMAMTKSPYIVNNPVGGTTMQRYIVNNPTETMANGRQFVINPTEKTTNGRQFVINPTEKTTNGRQFVNNPTGKMTNGRQFVNNPTGKMTNGCHFVIDSAVGTIKQRGFIAVSIVSRLTLWFLL
jgi:hypothetical protein